MLVRMVLMVLGMVFFPQLLCCFEQQVVYIAERFVWMVISITITKGNEAKKVWCNATASKLMSPCLEKLAKNYCYHSN